jgi:magnesium transporter
VTVAFCIDPVSLRDDGSASVRRRDLAPGEPIPGEAIWIDLLRPTREEDQAVERHLGISIPTREDMADIEPSELLYAEDGARYMTARLLYNANTDKPALANVTFILKERSLVTVRYDDPYAFTMYSNRLAKHSEGKPSVESIMQGLAETILDRAADVLQEVGGRIETLSRQVFDAQGANSSQADYTKVLRQLGHEGELVSKQRESLVSIERVLLFLAVAYRTIRVPAELRDQVRTTLRDLQSLEEHATFLTSKIQFLLDATLGLVNLEQNRIIKLFSVMAVIFMPPTLIASIYGMNFGEGMPELKWAYGYVWALGLMVAAAVIPILIFRWRKWL